MDTAIRNAHAPRQVVTIDDSTMLNKVRNAIKMLKGVGDISVVRPKKSDMELAREDIKAGRVTKWNSVDELFNTVLEK